MGKNDYALPEILLPGSMLQLLYWGYAEASPADYVDVHAHDFWQCNWGLSGSCEFHLDGQVFTLRRGDMIFIPPYTPHKLVYKQKLLTLSFKYRTNLSMINEPLFVKRSKTSQGIIRAAEILIQTAFPKKMIGLKSGMAVNADAHYQHLIEYLIAGTINFLLLKNNPLPEPANSLRQILRNSGGAPLGVQEAAQRLKISRNQLCNLVKSRIGTSAKEFIDQERALIALQYLKFSGMNIAEIADKMGFSTSGHFCKFFRRVTGKSPGNYREVTNLTVPEQETVPLESLYRAARKRQKCKMNVYCAN